MPKPESPEAGQPEKFEGEGKEEAAAEKVELKVGDKVEIKTPGLTPADRLGIPFEGARGTIIEMKKDDIARVEFEPGNQADLPIEDMEKISEN